MRPNLSQISTLIIPHKLYVLDPNIKLEDFTKFCQSHKGWIISKSILTGTEFAQTLTHINEYTSHSIWIPTQDYLNYYLPLNAATNYGLKSFLSDYDFSQAIKDYKTHLLSTLP